MARSEPLLQEADPLHWKLALKHEFWYYIVHLKKISKKELLQLINTNFKRTYSIFFILRLRLNHLLGRIKFTMVKFKNRKYKQVKLSTTEQHQLRTIINYILFIKLCCEKLLSLMWSCHPSILHHKSSEITSVLVSSKQRVTSPDSWCNLNLEKSNDAKY